MRFPAGAAPELQWFIRTRPKLLRTFAALWNTEPTWLITSFDGIGVFRPWSHNPRWETFDGWYYIDQNIVAEPGLDCVQGLVALTPQNKLTGGTVVVPQSHLLTPTSLSHQMSAEDSAFQVVRQEQMNELLRDPNALRPLLVSMARGDLLLWDSRLVHCSSPSLALLAMDEQHAQCRVEEACPETSHREDELLRVVSYVCMTPRDKASPEVLSARVSAFENGQTSNHNPHHPSIYANDAPAQRREYRQVDVDLIKTLVGYHY